MKVALTGGTGFIGGYIAREFMTPGDTLRALVRPSSDTAFLRRGGAELLVGDFGDDDSMQRLVDGMDVVIHNGYWHDRNELQDPMAWFELNVLGSLKLLEYTRRAGCRRFIFISTGAVYGRVNHPDEPRHERTGAFPNGGYAAYNRAVEVYIPAYRNEFDMIGSSSIRLCGVNVGVHPVPAKSPWIDIVRKALAGEEIRVGGTCQIDFNSDIGRNLRLVATMPAEQVEEVYCFCDGVYPLRDIAQTIVDALGSSSKVVEQEGTPWPAPVSSERIRNAGGTFSGPEGLAAYAQELSGALKAANE